jgi:hypothetical protein
MNLVSSAYRCYWRNVECSLVPELLISLLHCHKKGPKNRRDRQAGRGGPLRETQTTSSPTPTLTTLVSKSPGSLLPTKEIIFRLTETQLYNLFPTFRLRLIRRASYLSLRLDDKGL